MRDLAWEHVVSPHLADPLTFIPDLAADGRVRTVTNVQRPMRLHGKVHEHTDPDDGGILNDCCIEPVEKVERVVWTDSGMFIDEGWAKTEVYRSAATKWHGDVVTIGQPIYEDDKVLVLGLSHDRAHDHWYGAQLISKVNIKERTTL